MKLIRLFGALLVALVLASGISVALPAGTAGGAIVLCEFSQMVNQYGPALLTIDSEAATNVPVSSGKGKT